MSIEFGVIISSKDITTTSFSEIRRNEAYYEMENTILWENGEMTSYVDYVYNDRDYIPSDGLWRVRTSDGCYYECGRGLEKFRCKRTEQLEYELRNEDLKFVLHADPNIIWLYDNYINLPLSELTKSKSYSDESSFIHPLLIKCSATCNVKSKIDINLSYIQSLILLYIIKKREFYNDYDLDILKSLRMLLGMQKDIGWICQCTENLLERKRSIIRYLHGMELVIFDYFNLGKHISYLDIYNSNQ